MHRVDLSDFKDSEEHILSAFVEILNEENFEETYLSEDFEGDDIWLEASIDKKSIYEIGVIDNQTYVTIKEYNLQYYLDGTEINIIELFEEIVEDYKNAEP
jgi:hypothetical protein